MWIYVLVRIVWLHDDAAPCNARVRDFVPVFPPAFTHFFDQVPDAEGYPALTWAEPPGGVSHSPLPGGLRLPAPG